MNEEDIYIKRSDSIYKDIEKLNKYETSSCVIYEMYIRAFKQERIVISGDNPIIEAQKIKDLILFKSVNFQFTLQDIIYSLYPQLLDDAKEKITKKYNLQPTNIKELNNILSDFSFELEYLIDNYIDKSEIQKVTYKDLEKNEYVTVDLEKLKEIIAISNRITTISPNFRRPQLYYKENYFVNINHLNLALPDDELLNFIQDIKKKIINKTVKINTFFKKVSSSKYHFIDENIIPKNEPEHKYKIFDDLIKIADMFFIYDVVNENVSGLSKGEKNTYISEQILENRETTEEIAVSTIYNYLNTAKYYIDDKAYLELLKKIN